MYRGAWQWRQLPDDHGQHFRHMNPTFVTLDGFDSALHSAFERFHALCPDLPPAQMQRRFAQMVVFPHLGWGLLVAGQAQALAEDDPALLHGMLLRFVKCAYACWGEPDTDGLHWGGSDHCALVVPALHAAPLGPGWLRAAFHGERPLSTRGLPALRHLANLLTVLHVPDWRHRDRALAGARDFSARPTTRPADCAFVDFLMALHECQPAATAEALVRFADRWLRSDWGRHKPGTRAAWVWALLVLAERQLPGAVDDATQRKLLLPDVLALWQRQTALPPAPAETVHRFDGELAWLNELPFDPADRRTA
jgi:hypothetical protein